MSSNPSSPSAVAFIPARAGSKRVKDKNIRFLAGHPVMAYSISAALDSGVFSRVILSTDSPVYAEIGRHYGADVPYLRPEEISGDKSPDIEWLEYTLNNLARDGYQYDCFSILRPTSPFRMPETIRRAWNSFVAEEGVDSLRAVEKCSQHPGKMWVLRQNRMYPLMPLSPAEQPWHSTQYAALPEVYVQNASLEIAWTRVVYQGRTIAGTVIMPFLTEGHEGLDVNQEYDWDYAEALVAKGEVTLPMVRVSPWRPHGA